MLQAIKWSLIYPKHKKVCFCECESCLCWPIFTHFASKSAFFVACYQTPTQTHHLQGGMKFTTQISPLLNLAFSNIPHLFLSFCRMTKRNQIGSICSTIQWSVRKIILLNLTATTLPLTFAVWFFSNLCSAIPRNVTICYKTVLSGQSHMH